MSDPDDYWAKVEKRWAAKEKRDAVRRVPILYGRAPLGTCKWCNGEVFSPEGHKKAGQPNARKGWHDACLGDYFLHSRPEHQRNHLIQRDGEKCVRCGGAPLKVVRGVECFVINSPSYKGEFAGHYCQIDIRVDLHIEHTVPLWKIRHLPDADRVKYFGPDNLTLLCNAAQCHKAKTKAEAKERAHFDRLEETRVQPFPEKPNRRKMQSRGFDKKHTKTFGGKVKARKARSPTRS